MFIPALARFSQSVNSRCCVAFDWWLLSSREKHTAQIQKMAPATLIYHCHPPPLLFQQMSSLFLQWLALEGHIDFSSNCTRPEWFECLPKDNNRIHHADLRNELLLNQFMQRQRKQRQQHGFCQHEGDSSHYIKPQGTWSNLSADKVSSHFLQTENQKGKYYVL